MTEIWYDGKCSISRRIYWFNEKIIQYIQWKTLHFVLEFLKTTLRTYIVSAGTPTVDVSSGAVHPCTINWYPHPVLKIVTPINVRLTEGGADSVVVLGNRTGGCDRVILAFLTKVDNWSFHVYIWIDHHFADWHRNILLFGFSKHKKDDFTSIRAR